MTQVNRSLADKAMDRIDHALGRPVNPLSETYRNHYAANEASAAADQMSASPHWREIVLPKAQRGDLRFFEVTEAGRFALRDHLRQIGDRNRLWNITYGGFEMTEAAQTASKARYAKWLSLSDVMPDLTFKQFASEARVRRA